MKNKTKKAVILLIWLALWQIAAFFVNNPVYFASPVEVAAELVHKVGDMAFWQSVGGSLARILSGFLAAFLLAFLTAFISLRYRWLKEFISPFVTFLKSVPVAAVVVVLLIWWGSGYLVLCISLMVVFPNIYLNMLTGLANADKGLLEMADVFRLRRADRLLWIYRPAYLPYLHSAVSVSLGMGFKSGIAAEVIGLPEFSIGERLYRDKIYLDTAGVFAWVVVILIVSSLTERFIIYALRRIADIPPACIYEVPALSSDKSVVLDNIELPPGYTVYSEGIIKTYEGRTVIDTGVKLRSGHIYHLNAPSGAGKTTLLKIIAGITDADKGAVQAGRISMVFQDDRLIEHANGIRNLRLAGCEGNLKDELHWLLPERTEMLPTSELSGGERRRLAIARALLHPSDIVIMDEPFAGLDEETKEKTIDWVSKHLGGRTLLYTAHEIETVSFIDAEPIRLITRTVNTGQ